MNRRRLLSLSCALTALLLAGGLPPAAAQQAAWPTRSITLVVPFAAGGPTDVVARTLGAVMSKSLGQSVVIENKVGAGGTLAAGAVAFWVLGGWLSQLLEATPSGR